MKLKDKRFSLVIILVLCAAVVFPMAWLLATRLEGQAPLIQLTPSSLTIGRASPLTVAVSDEKGGLRGIQVRLVGGGKTAVLLDEVFPGGLLGMGKTRSASFDITIDPEKLGLSDGNATLHIVASDFSWRRWWHGNRTIQEINTVIDTRSPGIEVLTRVHNLSQGGSGVVVYRLSEPCSKSGVAVGDNFFPGHAGHFDDPGVILAFFALNDEQGKDTPLAVHAVDQAGNSAIAGFPHYIRRRVFKKDTIRISDGFLNEKMPEFSAMIPEGAGRSGLDTFIWVNRELRVANDEIIVRITAKTEARMMWDGRFQRLPNAATRANFADRREYIYGDKVIDHQVHQGIDLASLAHSPIPAANSGTVVFTGEIGIYGNSVIIDHGFGLFSMYGHLSAIDVQPGQAVTKDQILGRSGITGLAAGDHLHFSMLVHNTFVNPLEWWDPEWIHNNVTSKIDAVRTAHGEG